MSKTNFDILDPGNEFASIAIDGLINDACSFISSGSYALNALLSGSLFGGFPNNTVTAIAGAEASGKTFLCLDAVKTFQDSNPGAVCCWFDSESATNSDMMESRNLDLSRVKVFPVVTVEDFRHQLSRMLTKYLAIPKSDRFPLMFVLDSLGNLSTNKEVNDIEEGVDKRDMTRAQLVKGTFRALGLNLGLAQCPLLVTNHVYTTMGQMYPVAEMSGGSGIRYISSHVLMLGKSKDKDGKEVIGINVRCKMVKSRFTKENHEIQTRINYDTGMDAYYGLLPLAEMVGMATQVSTKWRIEGDESAHFEKHIYKSPETYFTEEFLKKLDAKVHKFFMYGNAYQKWLEKQGDIDVQET